MKTRYIVAYRLKEQFRHAGRSSRCYQSFAREKAARKEFDRIKPFCLYMALSYGFGNVLKQKGRDRDA